MARIYLTADVPPTIPCGIATYSTNLIVNLKRIDKNNQYYTNSDITKKTDVKIPLIDSTPFGTIYNTLITGHSISKYNFDIVHGVGNLCPLTFIKSKVVVTVHDIIPRIFNYYPYPMRWIAYNLVPRAIKKADVVITDSECTKRDIMRYYKTPENKIVVIPLATPESFRNITNKEVLDSVRNKYRLPKEFVLMLGGSDSRKNLLNLVRAFKRLVEKGHKEKLVISGIGRRSLRKITEIIKMHGLEKNTIIIGSINENDLPAIYSMTKLFAFPTLYEGFGLPPLEAMACGAPVLCSNVSSVPEVVGDAGAYIEPTCVDNIETVMSDVLKSESTRKELIAKGYVQTKKFSWEKTAVKTLEVYQHIMLK